MASDRHSGLGRARVPILIGIAGGFILMVVAIVVAITTGGSQRQTDASPSDSRSSAVQGPIW
jgi:hypothetical protein